MEFENGITIVNEFNRRNRNLFRWCITENYTMQWNLFEPETNDMNFSDIDIDFGSNVLDVEFQTIDAAILNVRLNTIAKIIELFPLTEIEDDDDVLHDVKIIMTPRTEYDVSIKITEVVKGQPSSLMIGDDIEEDIWD